MAGSLGLPYFIASSALGKAGAVAPSNRITFASIGLGWRGTTNMRAFLAEKDVQVVAVCDVEEDSDQYGRWFEDYKPIERWFEGHKRLGREPAREIVDEHYDQTGCDAYVALRHVIERDDIDAVCISTPDHWHAIPAIMAAKTGKHIYCEKPLSLTIAEGRAMIKAVERYGIIFQCGMQRRSNARLRHVCELIRNGRIGRLKKVRTCVGPPYWQAWAKDSKPMPVPDDLDYDMWLGPAPWVPYHKERCLFSFRFGSDYSGGQTTDNGVHYIDVAQWANGTDETGPVEYEDLGSEYPADGLFDTVTKVHFRARYENGVELTCETKKRPGPIRFEGTEGWIEAVGNWMTAEPESVLTSRIGPNEIHLYESNNHHRNFIDCIKANRETAAPVEVGHRSTSICHLGNIAMTLKKKLQWDPDTEKFTNSDHANQMLSRAMRSPWCL
jgi:predicted dehydrogenase